MLILLFSHCALSYLQTVITLVADFYSVEKKTISSVTFELENVMTTVVFTVT